MKEDREMKVTKVVLADDHQVVRRGIRSLLEGEPSLRVVGEAGDGVETVSLVEQLRPDLLIVDLMMPGQSGMEVIRHVLERSPLTRIVVLSMHGNEAYVLEALRRGASGYVLKEATEAELVRAVHEVLAGRRYLSPPLSERAIEAYIKSAGSGTDPYELLTSREQEALRLAAEGHTSAEIASRLSISPRTAETHRANLLRKLGLRSQAELVRYALQRGILPLDGPQP